MWKKILFAIVLVFFAFVLINGFSYEFSNLFFIPMLAVCFFLAFYFNKQEELDRGDQFKKAAKYAAEDKTAEDWVNTSLAPDTLTYIKANRWIIIIYSFIFIGFVTFIWSYLTSDMLLAFRNFAYAGVLFWSFILYVLLAPSLLRPFGKIFPSTLSKLFNNDWLRGYIFLLPITFYVFLLFPYSDNMAAQFSQKLASFPAFFLVYSSFFLCMFCVVYMYEDIKRSERKEIEKAVKKSLAE